MIADNKGGMFIRDTLQRGSQPVTFINEERDVLKCNILSQVEITLGYKQTHKAVERHVDNEDAVKRSTLRCNTIDVQKCENIYKYGCSKTRHPSVYYNS